MKQLYLKTWMKTVKCSIFIKKKQTIELILLTTLYLTENNSGLTHFVIIVICKRNCDILQFLQHWRYPFMSKFSPFMDTFESK